MIDTKKLNDLLLPAIQKNYNKISEIDDFKSFIPFEEVLVTTDH